MCVQFNCIEAIRQSGFGGLTSISDLQRLGCRTIPDEPGVYFVLRTDKTRPEFLQESRGGHFKGRNPTVPISVLERKWVEDAIVLYIGKAGPLKGRTLKTRLNQYMRFGQGIPVGHWGGRYIWQLQDSADLLVCWKSTLDADSRIVGSDLIRQFEDSYHKLPFANCVH